MLLGLAFPGGPLPDDATFAGLSRLQRDVVHVLLTTGDLDGSWSTKRAVEECNLPNTRQRLVTWASGQAPLF